MRLFLSTMLLSALAMTWRPPSDTFYASPSASGGSGTFVDPWDLQTALNATGTIGSGDTLYLRGGTYTRSITLGTDNYMFRSTLSGSAGSPINVEPYQDEEPKIDANAAVPAGGYSALYVNGNDVIFKNIEIFDSNPDRTQNAGNSVQVNGIYDHCPRCKFINMVIHDVAGDCFGFWEDATGGTLYGNLCFNNGVHDVDDNVYWGHGVYGQNDAGTKLVQRNIILHQWSTGIGPHASANQINNFTIDDNVAYANGSWSINPGGYDTSLPGTNFFFDLTSSDVVSGLKVRNNHVYYPGGLAARESFQLTQPTTSAIVTGNYFIRGGINLTGTQTSPTYTGNTIVHSFLTGWTEVAYPTNTYYDATMAEAPTTNVTVVLTNTYNNARGHIIVYNWEALNAVTVDISSLGWTVGSNYSLRNTEDYYTDVTTGVITGSTISIDMQDASHSVATPTNWGVTPATTFPGFGVFVIDQTEPPPTGSTTSRIRLR